MASLNILVVGATGQQGGAVVKALLDLPAQSPPIHILALTRNAESPKAKALASAHRDSLTLVQGDATDPEPIFAAYPKESIARLFIVTVPGKIPEEKQAIPLIDAAVAHGVRHIVFTSVERGGDERSWSNPTDVPHFIAKHNVELHLRQKAESDSFTWTILRPVAFLDNWNPGFFSSMFSALMYASLKPETKLQLVSVRDIGVVAALALTQPDKWAGRAVGLAGDEITLSEAQETFKKVTGKDLPQTYTVFAKLLLWLVKEVGTMFTFFEKEGYHADIAALRREVPGLQDFETWLRESSKWEKKD
ncbi:hypothetical protein B0H63DRAFT_191825 [Podospora didyma]|uniref:NmrA-like domain-containing protein n=1 Tax=Podospora didyma TaxID=330526 RepID=A0AAE0NQX0_9PEZI|nr:hypothetical protein B0H63DRAFT_191825 [Podospora didyma]